RAAEDPARHERKSRRTVMKTIRSASFILAFASLTGVEQVRSAAECPGEARRSGQRAHEEQQRLQDRRRGTHRLAGRSGYNQDLSQRRAQAVRDYLVSRGIAADRVTAVGFGLTRPIADNA